MQLKNSQSPLGRGNKNLKVLCNSDVNATFPEMQSNVRKRNTRCQRIVFHANNSTAVITDNYDCARPEGHNNCVTIPYNFAEYVQVVLCAGVDYKIKIQMQSMTYSFLDSQAYSILYNREGDCLSDRTNTDYKSYHCAKPTAILFSGPDRIKLHIRQIKKLSLKYKQPKGGPIQVKLEAKTNSDHDTWKKYFYSLPEWITHPKSLLTFIRRFDFGKLLVLIDGSHSYLMHTYKFSLIIHTF
jgi:hypothetical protein